MTESTSRFDYRCFHLHAETSDSGLLYILDSSDIIVKKKDNNILSIGSIVEDTCERSVRNCAMIQKFEYREKSEIFG